MQQCAFKIIRVSNGTIKFILKVNNMMGITLYRQEDMLSEGLYCILNSSHHFSSTVNLRKLSMKGGGEEVAGDQRKEEDGEERRRRSEAEVEYVVTCNIKVVNWYKDSYVESISIDEVCN